MRKLTIFINIGIFSYVLFFILGIFLPLEYFRIVAALIVGCLIFAAIPFLVLGYVHLMFLFIPEDKEKP